MEGQNNYNNYNGDPHGQQPYYQNPQYPPYPNYPNPMMYEDTSPLSVGSYLIMILVSCIPLVNIIMLFVWGFGHSNANRKNFARAQLIVLLISVVICIIFGASIISSLSSLRF